MSAILSTLSSKDLEHLQEKANDGSLGSLIDGILSKSDTDESAVAVVESSSEDEEDQDQEPEVKRLKLDKSVESEIEDEDQHDNDDQEGESQHVAFLSAIFPQLSLEYLQARADTIGKDKSKLQTVIEQIIVDEGIGMEDDAEPEAEELKVEENEKNSSEKLFKKLTAMFPNVSSFDIHEKALEISLDINKNVETVTEELKILNEEHGKQKIDVTTFSENVVPEETDRDSLAFLETARTIFRSLLNKMKLPEVKNPDDEIESIKIVKNSKLTEEYENTMINFISRGIAGFDGELEELYLFHGTKEESLKGIIKNNFQLDAVPINQDGDAQRRRKGQVYGKGFYFTEYPGLGLSYGNALVLCKVLLGKCELMDINDPKAKNDIIEGWHSKKLNSKKHDGYMYVIKEASQILPVGIITLKNKDIFNDIYKRNHSSPAGPNLPMPVPPRNGWTLTNPRGYPQGQVWINPLANFRFPWQGPGPSPFVQTPATITSSQMTMRDLRQIGGYVQTHPSVGNVPPLPAVPVQGQSNSQAPATVTSSQPPVIQRPVRHIPGNGGAAFMYQFPPYHTAYQTHPGFGGQRPHLVATSGSTSTVPPAANGANTSGSTVPPPANGTVASGKANFRGETRASNSGINHFQRGSLAQHPLPPGANNHTNVPSRRGSAAASGSTSRVGASSNSTQASVASGSGPSGSGNNNPRVYVHVPRRTLRVRAQRGEEKEDERKKNGEK